MNIESETKDEKPMPGVSMKKYVLAELDAELASLIKNTLFVGAVGAHEISCALLLAKYLKLIAHKLID